MSELQQAISAASNNSNGGVQAPLGVPKMQTIPGTDNLASRGSLDRIIIGEAAQTMDPEMKTPR